MLIMLRSPVEVIETGTNELESLEVIRDPGIETGYIPQQARCVVVHVLEAWAVVEDPDDIAEALRSNMESMLVNETEDTNMKWTAAMELTGRKDQGSHKPSKIDYSNSTVEVTQRWTKISRLVQDRVTQQRK